LSRYYYLVSSLPVLLIEAEAPITEQYFIDMCKSRLTAADLLLLQQAVLLPVGQPYPRNGTLDRWFSWEHALRNELVKLRATALSRDPHAYFRGDEAGIIDFTEIEGIARDALGQQTPLISEESLIKARWNFLDGLEIGHYFDIDRVIIYYLKLQLLLRKELFKADEGKEEFERIYTSISEPILEKRAMLEESLENA
jgi:hypothetical protein